MLVFPSKSLLSQSIRDSTKRLACVSPSSLLCFQAKTSTANLPQSRAESPHLEHEAPSKPSPEDSDSASLALLHMQMEKLEDKNNSEARAVREIGDWRRRYIPSFYHRKRSLQSAVDLIQKTIGDFGLHRRMVASLFSWNMILFSHSRRQPFPPSRIWLLSTLNFMNQKDEDFVYWTLTLGIAK